MVNIQNHPSGRVQQVLAEAQSLRGLPVIRAAARGEGMPLREAERQLAQLKARSERNAREHRADMRRRSGDYQDLEPLPRVDAMTHDYASVFVQAQFGPLDRAERRAQHREVGDAMVFCHARGLPFTVIVR